jgi:hypothetical protein
MLEVSQYHTLYYATDPEQQKQLGIGMKTDMKTSKPE